MRRPRAGTPSCQGTAWRPTTRPGVERERRATVPPGRPLPLRWALVVVALSMGMLAGDWLVAPLLARWFR